MALRGSNLSTRPYRNFTKSAFRQNKVKLRDETLIGINLDETETTCLATLQLGHCNSFYLFLYISYEDCDYARK